MANQLSLRDADDFDEDDLKFARENLPGAEVIGVAKGGLGRISSAVFWSLMLGVTVAVVWGATTAVRQYSAPI